MLKENYIRYFNFLNNNMKSSTEDDIKAVDNGRFTISHMIGKGAFGKIYEAYDTIQKIKVAVKVVNALNRKQSQLKLRSCFLNPEYTNC